jgi:peptidyl-prolyl cis-trans isomerase D
MAQKMGLGQVALQQMVSRAALDNESDRLGLNTPDAEVVQEVRGMAPFRGPLGSFDRPTFLQAVGNAGYSEDQFIAETRRDMTRNQLTQAVEGNFMIPPTYAQALFEFINERRAADYVIVSPDAAGAIAPPGDAVLAAYVKANPDRFSTPEYRDADYASITAADVMPSVTVTDAQIKQAYDNAKATYQVPEKRDVQQIEFQTESQAKDARAKIQGGMTFEALAATLKKTDKDISLGTLAQSDLPDADRAKAIFALPVDEVSQPVKTGFGGWALVRVTKITPGVNRPLDEVKDEIRKGLAQQLAANKLVDAVNAFTDARSDGDDLDAAAKKAGMKVGHVKAVDAGGMTPDGARAEVPADPEFLPALFKAEVGEDSDPFSTKAGNYFVMKVNGVTPPKLRPLDLVRADAINSWTQEQRSKLVAQKAAALTAQAEKEKSLDGAAKALKVSVQHSPALNRQTNDTMFSAPIVAKLFDAKPDGIVSGPQGLSGNYIIAKVTGITHPRLDPRDRNFTGGMAQLAQGVASDMSIAMANAARARQGVKVNRKLLDTVTGSGG